MFLSGSKVLTLRPHLYTLYIYLSFIYAYKNYLENTTERLCSRAALPKNKNKTCKIANWECS